MRLINKETDCTIILELDCFYNIHRVEVWHNNSERLVLGYTMRNKCVLSSSCLSSRDFKGSVSVTNAMQEALTIFDNLDETTIKELNELGYYAEGTP